MKEAIIFDHKIYESISCSRWEDAAILDKIRFTRRMSELLLMGQEMSWIERKVWQLKFSWYKRKYNL